MSLTATDKGNTEFEMTPEGTYLARCYKIIDLGTQTTTGAYGTKEQHKVMVSWELLDDEVKMDDGRPFTVNQWYTVSLHEKAKMRADLEAWRGKKFTKEELEGFDLGNVLGAYCMIQVIHDDTGKYANVNSIMSFKGQKPLAYNQDIVFDIDNPDMEVFNMLSDNMKGKIMQAPEWQEWQESQKPPKPPKPPKPVAQQPADKAELTNPAMPEQKPVTIEDLRGEYISLEDIPF